MRNKIVYRLKKLEKKHDIKILLAVESGSRAYGLENDSSDWDIRFIYVHKLNWYLDLKDNKNTIELIDNNFDFQGWELSKALKLLVKGNTQLQEWVNSPKSYISDPEFFYPFKELCADNFNKQSAIRYYLAYCDKYYKGYLNSKAYVDPNMYLKALRPLLAGFAVQKRGKMPSTLMEASMDLLKPYTAYDPVVSILKQYTSGNLPSSVSRNEDINDFIEETMYFLDMCLLDLKSPEVNIDNLNKFLYKSIMDFTNDKI